MLFLSGTVTDILPVNSFFYRFEQVLYKCILLFGKRQTGIFPQIKQVFRVGYFVYYRYDIIQIDLFPGLRFFGVSVEGWLQYI